MVMTQLPPSAQNAGMAPMPGGTPPARMPESVYLRYLPNIFQQDPFLRRFLLIFESVLRPIEGLVDNLPLYTEAEIAPAEFLPWLAHWVALTLDSSWPLERQRALISHAVEIYRWRGTRFGLKLHIQCYTGIEPLIQEYSGGFVLGQDNRLGLTTQLVGGSANPLLFVVTVPVANARQVDPQVLRAIIEDDKPAHTTYRLRVVRAGAAHRSRVARPEQRAAPAPQPALRKNDED